MAGFKADDYGINETFSIEFDTQTENLERLVRLMNDLKFGSSATQATISGFIKTLGAVDASGRKVSEVVSKFKELSRVLGGRYRGELQSAMKSQLEGIVRSPVLDSSGRPTGQFILDNTFDNNIASRADALSLFGEGGTRGLRYQGIVRLTTLVSGLTRAMNAFVERTAKANRELFLLASHAQSSVKDIATMGGALEAFGGSRGEATRFSRSFESEMAKMRVGQGTGGKFLEAARLWGLNFIPNDFNAQERAIVEFLSDKNRSQTEKIGLIDTLGLSQAQVARYSQGIEAFDKENALQESLHKNAAAAAEAANKYQIASQHLNAQMEDIKNAFMIPLLNILAPIKEFLAENEWAAATIGLGKIFYDVGKEIIKLVAILRFAGLLKGGGGLLGGLLGGGAAAAGTAAGTVGGGAGSVGGTVGRLAGGAAGVAGALAGAVTGLMGEQVLLDIRALLNSWFAIWCVMNGATGNKTNSRDVIKRALEDLPGIGIGAFNDSAKMQFASNMAGENYFRQVENREALIAFNRAKATGGTNGQNAARVTIEKIEIAVEGGASSPEDVAQAVHDHLLREMREVVISLDPGGRV